MPWICGSVICSNTNKSIYNSFISFCTGGDSKPAAQIQGLQTICTSSLVSIIRGSHVFPPASPDTKSPHAPHRQTRHAPHGNAHAWHDPSRRCAPRNGTTTDGSAATQKSFRPSHGCWTAPSWSPSHAGPRLPTLCVVNL